MRLLTTNHGYCIDTKYIYIDYNYLCAARIYNNN
jgi:hypothetical protein